MTPLDLNLLLFVMAVGAFAWLGFSASRRQTSARDYFHNAHLHKNVVSLTATNITLGTGLVYLVSGAQQNGLLMLLPAVCVGGGYWLLSEFVDRVSTLAARTDKNYLAALDDAISTATRTRSSFGALVSGCLVAVFVLLLAFEIFASAKVIAPFLFRTPDVRAEVILSTVIFCITVLYAVLGGVRAIFSVDVIQVPLVCLFLPVFAFIAIPDWSNPSVIAIRLGASLKTNPTVIAAIGIACMNSLATQFYSILNWGAVSNIEVQQQKTLLRSVGLLTTVVLVLFVLVGLLHPVGTTGHAWQDLLQHLSTFAHSTGLESFVLSAIIMLGMAAILLTTTDAIVVNAILFWYDNLSRGDSKSDVPDAGALRRVRQIGFATFGACFAILCAINYLQPDPFYLLLGMAGGVVVFAPMIITAGMLSRRPRALRVFSRRVVASFVWIFIVSGVADAILLSQKSKLIPYVGLTAFLVASALSLFLIWRARSLRE